MGKDPAFLFYPNDYLGGTMGFSLEQHGAYLLALLLQFNNGPFSEDQIKSIIGDKWYLISSKFKKNENLYFNDRLQSEIERRHNYSASRRKNIGSRWNKNDKRLSGKKIDRIHMNNICNTHVIHMENENETRNEDEKETEDENIINQIYRACSLHLSGRILETRRIKIDEKKLRSWDNEVRLMIERDKRTQQEIIAIIDECHDMPPRPGSGFTWRDNILSMKTLRQKYNDGKIYIGMNNAQKPKPLYGRQEVSNEELRQQWEIPLS